MDITKDPDPLFVLMVSFPTISSPVTANFVGLLLCRTPASKTTLLASFDYGFVSFRLGNVSLLSGSILS